MIRHTHREIVAITKAVQRGYLQSREASYLTPYAPLVQAVNTNLAAVKPLTIDNPAQQQRIARLEPLIIEKRADLDLTVAVRRDQGFPAAQRLVVNNYSRDVMDIIRAEVSTMLDEEERLMVQRNASAQHSYDDTATAAVSQSPLFRLLQEGLNNAAKHANAGHVALTLAHDDQNVILSVKDGGIGITTERAGTTRTHGLLGMRERASCLGDTAVVSSLAGQGTRVVICLPLSPRATQAPDLQASRDIVKLVVLPAPASIV